MRSVFVLLPFLLGSPVREPVVIPAPSEPRQEEIAGLESSDPVIARRAFEALVRRGEDKPLSDLPRKSDRVAHVLAEIRAHRRFGDAYPPLEPIRYEAEDRPTRELLEDFRKILKLPIDRARPESVDVVLPPLREKTTIRLKAAYPLEALDELGRALDETMWVTDGTLKHVPGARRPPVFRTYARHFLIDVERFVEERHRESTGETKETTYLWMRLQHDWLVRIVGMRPVRFLHISDDLGHSLLPDSPPDQASWGDFQNLSSQLFIKTPDPRARKLARLKGVVPYFFPERPATAELSLSADKKELSLKNLVLNIEKASPTCSEVRVTGRVGDLNAAHVWPEVNEFQLKGKDGRLLTARGARAGQRESAVWDLSFAVPEAFEPSALRIRHFEGVGEHEIAFEFTDVPIR